jgi:transcriptional regulator with XRE-family HTH domain
VGNGATISTVTKTYSYQKWQTLRVWPGGGWGEALAQVRKDQHLTQRDVATPMGVSLATVRKWEDGLALPDRSFCLAPFASPLTWAFEYRPVASILKPPWLSFFPPEVVRSEVVPEIAQSYTRVAVHSMAL